METHPCQEEQQTAAKQVETFLQAGQFEEACEAAMEAELWDMALMLSYNLAQGLWPGVSKRWMQSRFHAESVSVCR